MNTFDETPESRDVIDGLLSKAEARQAPPPEIEEAVEAAVRAEWETIVAARKRSLLGRRLAIAASVVVAATATFVFLREAPNTVVELASIDQHAGRAILLREQSNAIDIADTPTIQSGDEISTMSGAAVGVQHLSGGSLRIDENTRVEFADEATVFLHRGRIYFDTEDEVAPNDFVVESVHGVLTHLGTQYMAQAGGDRLVVSVREGRVKIDGYHHDQVALAGKQVTFEGSSRPEVLDIPAHGSAWAWIEAVVPDIDWDGRTAAEFLRWFGRETGLQIEYDNESTEAFAKQPMHGQVPATDPRTELRLRMMAAGLDYELLADVGVLRISLPGTGGP